MKPKLAIVGHPLLRSFFEELLIDKGLGECSVYYEATFEQVPSLAEKIKREKDFDVAFCGWGYVHFFTELSIPVVPIIITGFDILDALAKAKYISKNVVFMRYGTSFEVERYSETLDMEIVSSFYLDREDAKNKIEQFMAHGYKTFIGTGLMYDVAKDLGANAIFIYSRDSIANTLDQVWQLAVSRRLEIERGEQFRTILENAREGIIAVDENFKCVLVNTEAEKMLEKVRERLLEHLIEDFWPMQNIKNCFSKAESFFSVVEIVNGKKFLVDYIPHFVIQEISGIVITLRDFSTVQEAEQVIRRTLYNKGHIARYSFANIVGNSITIQRTVSLAIMYAKSDSTVLITGESGTGKELFAQSIHKDSRRNDKPFIALNCAALTETLLDSELFGYEEGSFTGAKKGGKSGLFEIAHEGTLYLDEVGELSIEMQSKLLRVLQERQIRRVGGSSWFHVDVRIIAATNRDLRKMVAEGTFREDLYYRLNVLSLFVPPLRARTEDIPELVNSFCKRHHAVELAELIAQTITEKTINHNWPGNVRELENIIQRLLVAFRWEKENEENELLQMVFSDLTIKHETADKVGQYELERQNNFRQKTLDSKETILTKKMKVEKELILKVLTEFGGNRSKTAQYLGISRATLWKKLKD